MLTWRELIRKPATRRASGCHVLRSSFGYAHSGRRVAALDGVGWATLGDATPSTSGHVSWPRTRSEVRDNYLPYVLVKLRGVS